MEQNSPESMRSNRQERFGNSQIKEIAYGADNPIGLAGEIDQGFAQTFKDPPEDRVLRT